MKYKWDGEDFVPVDEWIEKQPQRKRSDLPSPMIMRDTPGVVSPIDDSFVEGRAARREHMKRHNVREVDPSEFTPRYENPKRRHLNRD